MKSSLETTSDGACSTAEVSLLFLLNLCWENSRNRTYHLPGSSFPLKTMLPSSNNIPLFWNKIFPSSTFTPPKGGTRVLMRKWNILENTKIKFGDKKIRVSDQSKHNSKTSCLTWNIIHNEHEYLLMRMYNPFNGLLSEMKPGEGDISYQAHF